MEKESYLKIKLRFRWIRFVRVVLRRRGWGSVRSLGGGVFVLYGVVGGSGESGDEGEDEY